MLPSYLKKKLGKWDELHKMKKNLRSHSLNTVCESARCPNISECFSRGVATFMILGDICSRSCAFCAVNHKKPRSSKDATKSSVSRHPSPITHHLISPDLNEAKNVAKMAKELALKHVVITSVTRDDLADGGASVFASTIREIKSLGSSMKIEVLTPDFQGRRESLEVVVKEKPDIFAHNLETIPRLYPEIRNGANYPRSLELLKRVKEFDSQIVTKSGIMVGLGETKEEVIALFEDLRKVGCQSLCIGHYLQPTRRNIPVKEYIDLEIFKLYEEKGYEMGFEFVVSGPFVRSSYLSEQVFSKTINNNR